MRDFQNPGRSPAFGSLGAAATSHPLATMAAIDVLRSGGNAIDAAIAAVALLGVVEPQSTGIGGDCFALLSLKGGSEVIAFNGSGRAPAGTRLEWFLERGIGSIDADTPHAVTIPGAVDAWCQLVADYGTRSIGELLEPAIRMAEEGYPVYPRVAHDWALSIDRLLRYEHAARHLTVAGKAPKCGELHFQPALARTMRSIAEKGRSGFYEGSVADDLVSYLQSLGGFHTLEDFASHCGEYVQPIRTAYRGFDVYECPPNGQGLAVLLMLNILERFDLTRMGVLSAERLHLQIEASKLAYEVRDKCIADGLQSVDHFLSDQFAAQLKERVRADRAMVPHSVFNFPVHPSTVYLCVVDKERNVVSLINSIFSQFGSGLVGPSTGVTLQNRGCGFSLDAQHPNAIAPAKRPFHTIIPGLLMKSGRPIMPFGVMGGHFQPTGHVHLLSNMIDFHLDVQGAIDCPRIFYADGMCLAEDGIPEIVRSRLSEMGHRVYPSLQPLGGGQAIRIDWETGVLAGGSDHRKDGCALAYH